MGQMVGTNVFAAETPAGSAFGPTVTARIFGSLRHTTRYWEAGPSYGPLMIFLHGWPEVGLMWRAHMEAFASEGFRCVAPDI
jgi:pimeloyl-ACP methyl ester carboxylesterase